MSAGVKKIAAKNINKALFGEEKKGGLAPPRKRKAEAPLKEEKKGVARDIDISELIPKYPVVELTEEEKAAFGQYTGKFDGDNYTIPAYYNERYGALMSVRNPLWTKNKNADLTRWKMLSDVGLKSLRGRIEIQTKTKSNPRVKFVRSGKRWGVIIG